MTKRKPKNSTLYLHPTCYDLILLSISSIFVVIILIELPFSLPTKNEFTYHNHSIILYLCTSSMSCKHSDVFFLLINVFIQTELLFLAFHVRQAWCWQKFLSCCVSGVYFSSLKNILLDFISWFGRLFPSALNMSPYSLLACKLFTIGCIRAPLYIICFCFLAAFRTI